MEGSFPTSLFSVRDKNFGVEMLKIEKGISPLKLTLRELKSDKIIETTQLIWNFARYLSSCYVENGKSGEIAKSRGNRTKKRLLGIVPLIMFPTRIIC